MDMTAETLRKPKLAGTWYPASTGECERLFDTFEREIRSTSRAKPAAGVVPHAGWAFSGSLAYNVLRELARQNPDTETVVLFAGHLHPESMQTLMVSGYCWTPLGPLRVDEPMADLISRRAPLRRETPQSHTQDNAAEVLFPLIRHLFAAAELLLVGTPPHLRSIDLADAVVDAAETLGRKMVAIGSTDLTHYGPSYGFTPWGRGAKALHWVTEVNDPAFVDAVCQGTPGDVIKTGLARSNACCPGAAAAAMRCAIRLGCKGGELLRYATSHDVRASDDFVGYASIVI